jgi:uncharacterized protein
MADTIIVKRQIDEVIEKIIRLYKPRKIILFGSYAYGQPGKHSDVDLLIIKETKQPRWKRGREINKLFNPYPFPMDILVYTPDEFTEGIEQKRPFLHEIITKGKVLYG